MEADTAESNSGMLFKTAGVMIIGFGVVQFLLQLFTIIKLYVFDQRVNYFKFDLRQKYGQWAVVTGATDGIGLAMAKQLARRGMSVVAVGRNPEKLAKTKTMLQQEPNAGEILTVQYDFTDVRPESYQSLTRQIDPRNRDISILINNVGAIPLSFMRFCRINERDLMEVIKVNIFSTTMLTRSLMPYMIERGRGLVVCVSSMASSITMPCSGAYTPTKAYGNSLFRQLRFEYRKFPIELVNLTTGPVLTGRIKRRGTSPYLKYFLPTPDQYARSVVNILETKMHPAEFSGLATHAILKNIQDFMQKVGCLALATEMVFHRLVEKLSPPPTRRKKKN